MTEKPQLPPLAVRDGKSVTDRIRVAHAVRTAVMNIYHDRGFDQMHTVDLVWIVVDHLISMIALSREIPREQASRMVRDYMLKANAEIEQCYALMQAEAAQKQEPRE
jgi:hypothetical protein